MRVPHARSDAEKVAKAAVEMANALAPHNELLVDAGYERAYLEDLRTRALVLVEAAGDSVRARTERGRLTADIAAEFKEGMRALTVMEGMMLMQLADEPALMRMWKYRRRVTKRLGRPMRRKR